MYFCTVKTLSEEKTILSLFVSCVLKCLIFYFCYNDIEISISLQIDDCFKQAACFMLNFQYDLQNMGSLRDLDQILCVLGRLLLLFDLIDGGIYVCLELVCAFWSVAIRKHSQSSRFKTPHMSLYSNDNK